MASNKDGDSPVRKITKLGSGSYTVTIPVNIIRKLHWQDRQKVVVEEEFGIVSIKDWEKQAPTKVASDKVDLKRGIDHIGVTVNFFIHDGKGKILLQKRSKNCRDEQGCWDIGGGAIEFGEELEEAVAREVQEELCAIPKKIEFVQVYDAHRDNNGTQTHWVAINFAVLVNPKNVKIGEPHKIDEIGWFTKDNLPSPLHSQFFKAFQSAIDKGLVK
jgi:ADP-ribose pyrophosphatase YjhB (NUDIX family)